MSWVPQERDLEQRNPWAIIPFQAKFPTPHVTVWSKSNIMVWGSLVLHCVSSLSLGEPISSLTSKVASYADGVVTFLASLSSGPNWLWGLLLLK